MEGDKGRNGELYSDKLRKRAFSPFPVLHATNNFSLNKIFFSVFVQQLFEHLYFSPQKNRFAVYLIGPHFLSNYDILFSSPSSNVAYFKWKSSTTCKIQHENEILDFCVRTECYSLFFSLFLSQ